MNGNNKKIWQGVTILCVGVAILVLSILLEIFAIENIAWSVVTSVFGAVLSALCIIVAVSLLVDRRKPKGKKHG